MEYIRFLVIDDEYEQRDLIQQVIEEINEEQEGIKIEFDFANTPDMAMISLYKNSYQAIIIDLKLLNTDDGKNSDEEISGNILLKTIMDKEILPIVVRTGYPDKVTAIQHNNIIKIYSKDADLYEVFNELITLYGNSVFKIFGSRGEVDSYAKELFWKIIQDEDVTEVDEPEKIMVRYMSSWFMNKYMFDEKYNDVHPIEMYMFPNPIKQVCTCDIFEKEIDGKKSHYLVLSPSCDLANKKADQVLLCEIKPYDQIRDFKAELESYNKMLDKTCDKGEKKKADLYRWFRNSSKNSMRYHFLPSIKKFDGGFVDFKSMIFINYDKETGCLKDNSYIKLGIITESFTRNIISRFASYYQRQGQPEFNNQIVLNNIISRYK